MSSILKHLPELQVKASNTEPLEIEKVLSFLTDISEGNALPSLPGEQGIPLTPAQRFGVFRVVSSLGGRYSNMAHNLYSAAARVHFADLAPLDQGLRSLPPSKKQPLTFI